MPASMRSLRNSAPRRLCRCVDLRRLGISLSARPAQSALDCHPGKLALSNCQGAVSQMTPVRVADGQAPSALGHAGAPRPPALPSWGRWGSDQDGMPPGPHHHLTAQEFVMSPLVPPVPLTFRFAAHPASARPARRAVVGALPEGVGSGLRGDLELIASELVTNACRYGAGAPESRIEVTLWPRRWALLARRVRSGRGGVLPEASRRGGWARAVARRQPRRRVGRAGAGSARVVRRRGARLRVGTAAWVGPGEVRARAGIRYRSCRNVR
ncbi:ATP-binding protein [Streptomyces sp. SID11385]|uniref:ATP-binding protein n=1 Tax=Streptomyces sp. SID11385 TaxID=2706031 RepID=UPI0031BB0383